MRELINTSIYGASPAPPTLSGNEQRLWFQQWNCWWLRTRRDELAIRFAELEAHDVLLCRRHGPTQSTDVGLSSISHQPSNTREETTSLTTLADNKQKYKRRLASASREKLHMCRLTPKRGAARHTKWAQSATHSEAVTTKDS